MKRRVISLVLVLCMMFSFVPSAYAADLSAIMHSLDTTNECEIAIFGDPDSGAIVKVCTVEGNAGDTVSVPVTIEHNPGFAGFTFAVTSDPALTLTKVSKGGLLKESDSGALTHNDSNGQINWTDYCNEIGDGELLVLTFKVDENAAEDLHSVSIELKEGKAGNFVSEDDTAVAVAFVSGGVLIAHSHNYVLSTVKPTCVAQGYDLYVCACGDSYKENYVDALGHDIEKHDAKAATATQIGWEAYETCKRCDYTTYKEIAPLGDDIEATATIMVDTVVGTPGGTVTVPVTIKNNPGFAGFTFVITSDYALSLTAIGKGSFLKESDSGALTPNVSKGQINWTDYCNEIGDGELLILTFRISEDAAGGLHPVSIELKNGKASNFVSEDDRAVPVAFVPGGVSIEHIHVYTLSTIEPTCTEQGYDLYMCSCGDSYKENVVDALGHDIEKHDAKVATCTEIGWDAYETCNRCDDTTYVEIPALGHDIEKHDAKEAACTEIGWEAYETCSRCEYNTYIEIPALGHDESSEITAPTCTEAGYTTHICTRCKASYIDSTVAPLGHSYVEGICTRCGDQMFDEAIQAADAAKAAAEAAQAAQMKADELASMGEAAANEAEAAQKAAEEAKCAARVAEEAAAICAEAANALATAASLQTAETAAKAADAYDRAAAAQAEIVQALEMLAETAADTDENAEAARKVQQATEQAESIANEAKLCAAMYRASDEVMLAVLNYQSIDLSDEEISMLVKSGLDVIRSAKTTQEIDEAMAAVLDALSGATEECPSSHFTDVPAPDDWAHVGIDYCVANGYMNGVSDTIFNPSGAVTRAQLVTIFYRIDGSPEVSFDGVFTDVEAGLWYSDAIEWAAKNGIVNGVGENRFNPMGKITREQIAAILYRYSGNTTAEGNLDAFSDSATVSAYAVDAMRWAVSKGLINGLKTGETTLLSPKTSATRAQIAAIIMRFMDQ